VSSVTSSCSAKSCANDWSPGSIVRHRGRRCDQEIEIRRVPALLAQEGSKDRTAPQSRHVQQPRGSREARARGAVLQTSLTPNVQFPTSKTLWRLGSWNLENWKLKPPDKPADNRYATAGRRGSGIGGQFG